MIIPLVFIPFVENAFKYGVSPDENAKIELKIINTNGKLNFEILNKKLNKNPQETSTEIGINNIKKRLDLLYANKHELTINQNDETFCVNLNIDLR
jgi:sensor histidine kinase YesM